MELFTRKGFLGDFTLFAQWRVERYFENPSRFPDKSVLLTFDDGYRTMMTVTLPILLTFGYPAVIFVPTAFIGIHNLFDKDVEPLEEICSWNDLLMLENNGVSIQSHGVSHRPFTDLHKAEQLEELLFSKELLESRLENKVEVFAYPYGDPGVDPKTTSDLVSRAGYKAAFLYGGGEVSVPVVDSYRVTRVAMGPDVNIENCIGK
jgi:peptidoglycan/xylan/chitin deacetylase (PgdA/CDA1 family)